MEAAREAFSWRLPQACQGVENHKEWAFCSKKEHLEPVIRNDGIYGSKTAINHF